MLLLFVIQWNKQFTHVISVQKWLVPVVSSHPLLNLSPCASSLLKRCRDSLCPSFTHTQLLLLPFFFFSSLSFFPSIFTCNLSCTVQNLGVPSTHTQTHAQLDWQMICSSQMGAGTWMAPWPACRCTQSKSEIEKSRHSCAFPRSGTRCWGAPLCWKGWEQLGLPSIYHKHPCGRAGRSSWAQMLLLEKIASRFGIPAPWWGSGEEEEGRHGVGLWVCTPPHSQQLLRARCC